MHLAIYGEGGLGHEVLDLAMRALKDEKEELESVFFVVDIPSKTEYKAHRIFSFEEVCKNYTPQEVEFVIAVGEPEDRMRLYEQVKCRGFSLKTLIHPSANISASAIIGDGTIVQYCASISSDTEIGDNCLLQTVALIGHDCCIKEHCVISSNTAIAGHVTIGNNTYIAPGVIVKDRIQIGANSIVGMGAVVQRDIPDNVIALGNPARPMKNNDDKKVFR